MTIFSVRASAMESWARTRHAAPHSWPVFQNPASATVAATWSRSASGQTSTGALPPSSRWAGTTLAAAAPATDRPAPTLPVRAIMSIPGWALRAAPTVDPDPLTMFRTPGGRMPSASSARRRVVSGVTSLGLSTMVLPTISAGASFHATISNG